VAENPELLRRSINKAFLSGADYIEIRFDSLNLSCIEQAVKIAESVREKSIFTLRSSEEGGKFQGKIGDRILWLKKLSVARPMLLDVEYNTIKDNHDLIQHFDNLKVPLLVSWHDFEKTPPKCQLLEVLEKMNIYSDYIKLVTTAKNIDDALRVLDLYEIKMGSNLIAFAMGALGIISRILCSLPGKAPFTYAALDQSVAPGQLTIKQMRSIYDKLSIP
jgi:3-dehydroquinate dehydratase-1